MRWALVFAATAACWSNDGVEPAALHPAPPLATRPSPEPRVSHVVRGPGEAPSIELGPALVAAKKYAEAHDVHFVSQYLQGAVFDSASRQWVFDWQTPNAKGGMTIVTVHESGQITISYGE
jgi:hypothetical protein